MEGEQGLFRSDRAKRPDVNYRRELEQQMQQMVGVVQGFTQQFAELQERLAALANDNRQLREEAQRREALE